MTSQAIRRYLGGASATGCSGPSGVYRLRGVRPERMSQGQIKSQIHQSLWESDVKSLKVELWSHSDAAVDVQSDVSSIMRVKLGGRVVVAHWVPHPLRPSSGSRGIMWK